MIHNNIGQALEEEGSLDEAIRWYQQAIGLEPDTARFHANLGNALREKERPDHAVACYQTALRLDPVYADAHTGLGWLRARAGPLRRGQGPLPRGAAAETAVGPRPLPPRPGAGGAERIARRRSASTRGDPARSAPHGRVRPTGHAAARQDAGAGIAGDAVARRRLAAVRRQARQSAVRSGSGPRRPRRLRQGRRISPSGQRPGTRLAQQRGQGWFPENHVRFVDQLLAAFTPELFERMRGWGVDSERPVFIVGLPRLRHDAAGANPRQPLAGLRRRRAAAGARGLRGAAPGGDRAGVLRRLATAGPRRSAPPGRAAPGEVARPRRRRRPRPRQDAGQLHVPRAAGACSFRGRSSSIAAAICATSPFPAG